MEITEPRRLYQQLAADLKERIEQGVYLVGDKPVSYTHLTLPTKA